MSRWYLREVGFDGSRNCGWSQCGFSRHRRNKIMIQKRQNSEYFVSRLVLCKGNGKGNEKSFASHVEINTKGWAKNTSVGVKTNFRSHRQSLNKYLFFGSFIFQSQRSWKQISQSRHNTFLFRHYTNLVCKCDNGFFRNGSFDTFPRGCSL